MVLKAGVGEGLARAPGSGLPGYGFGERFVDMAVHVLSVGFSIGAVIALMTVAVPDQPAIAILSLAIYGTGLIAVFGFSAAYHLVPKRGWKELLRRLDHATIFVMISGSYTPFALVKMEAGVGHILFAAVWVVALVGVVLKLFFPLRKYRKLAIGLYLGLGWAALATADPLFSTVSVSAMVLLIVGGLLYTVGVIFHVWKRLPYQNAIWHVFVLAAAVCHFVAILGDVALAR